MSGVVFIGAQWGDEGKGKIVDFYAEKADVIARFQGGNNAGHTLVVNNKKVVLHLVPSGILWTNKYCVVGNGVVLDPEVFAKEVEELKATKSIPRTTKLYVSLNTHIIMPYHKIIDVAREKKASSKIGTTGRGIGPAYEDKVARTGIRVCDLENEKTLKSKLETVLKEKNKYIKLVLGEKELKLEDVYKTCLEYRKNILPFACDTVELMNNFIKSKKNILFEGAQGSMLDIEHGTYPFVTSSSTISANAAIGTGVALSAINKVVGVTKAYVTRVGNGPFPTELNNEIGEFLRQKGGEFGATTGRPRRCGWLDLVALRRAVMLNGINYLAITKLDVLNELKEIKVCIAYEYEGKKIKYVPQEVSELEKCKPVYKTFKGWEADLCSVRNIKNLPKNALNYLKFIQDYLETETAIISVGQERNANIVLKKLF